MTESFSSENLESAEESNSEIAPESVKSEKEILWEQKKAEVDEIKDRLNLGIDEHIKEAVAAFRVHKFQTNQSCEGHLDEKQHGETFLTTSAPTWDRKK